MTTRALRRRRDRQTEAKERQEEYDILSTKQKIARVEGRPGNSKKELRRLRS